MNKKWSLRFKLLHHFNNPGCDRYSGFTLSFKTTPPAPRSVTRKNFSFHVRLLSDLCFVTEVCTDT